MSYKTLNYIEQGGARSVVGGEIDIVTGGALKIAGVDKTAALAAASASGMAGVAAGYKVARGTVTPAASPQTVITGLATVVAVVVSLKGDPTVDMTMVSASVGNQAGAPAAGSFVLKSWKPTGTADTAPAAVTTGWLAVDWVAVGT